MPRADLIRTRRQLQDKLATREEQVLRFRATIGDGTGVVDIPNKRNFIYIRRIGRSRAEECLNTRVPRRNGLPIIVGYTHEQPDILQVLEPDWGGMAAPDNYPYVPFHHESHEFQNVVGGDDVTWMQSQQILPLLVYPTSPTSMIVNVYNGWYTWDKAWHYFETAVSADLTARIPGAAGFSCYVLISIDGATEALQYTDGVDFPTLMPPADREDMIPAAPDGSVPLAAIHLVNGMTSIDWDAIYDIRILFSTVGPAGTGAAPNDAQYVVMALDAGLTAERVLTASHDISIATIGGQVRVARSGDKILRFDAGGTIEEYIPNQAGLLDAFADCGAWDTIWLPNEEISVMVPIVIPDYVTVYADVQPSDGSTWAHIVSEVDLAGDVAVELGDYSSLVNVNVEQFYVGNDPGASGAAIYLSGTNSSVRRCNVCITSAGIAGVASIWTGIRMNATGAYVENSYVHISASGALGDAGIGYDVQDGTVVECRCYIEFAGGAGAYAYGIMSTNGSVWNCRVSAQTYGLYAANAGTTYAWHGVYTGGTADLRVDAATTLNVYCIQYNTTSVVGTLAYLPGDRVVPGAPGVHDHSTALTGGQNLRQLLEVEFEDAALLTIDVAGAITRTQVYHDIETNAGAASDNLDTINGGVEGDLLVIRPANGAHTVVVRHNVGNIWLQGGADISLDDINDHLALIYDGAMWCDIGGGGGGGALVDHDHSAAGVGGPNLREIEEFEFENAALLTIDAGGAITRTQVYHRVDTFGGAATDNLDTINGGVEGDIIIIRPENAGRSITVRHGIDNIYLYREMNVTLTAMSESLMLICNVDGDWGDIGTAGGGYAVFEAIGVNTPVPDQDGVIAMSEAAADPTFGANIGMLYVKDDGGGNTELYYIDEAGNVTKLTPPGALVDHTHAVGDGGPLDWDTIAAALGADVVHNHSAAGEGGTLDWDSIWSDAVHDHSAAGEGGTLDWDTAFSDAVHDHSAAGEGGTLDWDTVWSDAVHTHESAAEGGNLVDLNGGADALVLDADGDTSLSAPTDDQIDVEVGGVDEAKWVADGLQGRGSQYPNLGSATTADKWGHVYMAGSRELYPDTDGRGLFARAVNRLGIALYTNHFRSAANGGLGAVIPTGFTWRGAPFGGTPAALNYNRYDDFFAATAGGAGTRHFLADDVANAAASWQNKSIWGRIRTGITTEVGFRLDNGTDDNYAEIYMTGVLANATQRLDFRYRTAAGAVTTVSSGIIIPCDTFVVVRLYCYWSGAAYAVNGYLVTEDTDTVNITGFSTGVVTWMPAAGRIGFMVKNAGNYGIYDWFYHDFGLA